MSYSPDDVLAFTEPTKDFLCPLSANTYGIDFLAFKIRDMDSQKCVFEVEKDPDAPPPEFPPDFDFDQLRTIRYTFPTEFVKYKTVGTTLRFKVGNQPVQNFRMIERHYFKGKLMKSYDFNFQFCIPNSINEWEAIYDLPKLDDEEIDEICSASMDDSESDSFYFVQDKLVMHNKAKYIYRDTSDSKSG